MFEIQFVLWNVSNFNSDPLVFWQNVSDVMSANTQTSPAAADVSPKDNPTQCMWSYGSVDKHSESEYFINPTGNDVPQDSKSN